MRVILREFFLYAATLFLMDKAFGWVSIANNSVLLISAAAFLILNTVGRPLLKILWLPINIITLGLFSWVTHVIEVVLITLLIPGFSLSNFTSPAFQIGKVLFPALNLKMVVTYLIFSFVLSQGVSLMRWIMSGED